MIVKRRKIKILGQHFLNDLCIANKIVSFANIHENETVLEIGPGKGILTSILFQKAKKVIAVEIDEGLIKHLKKRFTGVKNLSLVHKDFLKYEIPLFSEKIKAIGNLPYSVGSRIILLLINYRDRFSEMVFMLQKEVAERFVASPGVKSYGSLSIFTQIYYDIEILMNISPESFSPQPKVFSALIKLKPKKHVLEQLDNPELFFQIVRLAFSHRRKKLRNNLKNLFSGENDIEQISRHSGIDLDQRGEMLSIKEYLKLTVSIDKYKEKIHPII